MQTESWVWHLSSITWQWYCIINYSHLKKSTVIALKLLKFIIIPQHMQPTSQACIFLFIIMYATCLSSDLVHCKIWQHYACNFHTYFLSKISLPLCVDYFMKRIKKLVPHALVSTSLVFLKISACLHDSTMHSVHYLFYPFSKYNFSVSNIAANNKRAK